MTHFKAPSGQNPPVARKQAAVSSWHGQSLVDDYAWLRAENWSDAVRDSAALDSDIRQYLDAENDYCDAAMRTLLGVQEKLIGEMRGRIKEDENEIPENDGEHAYYWRYQPGAEHPLFARIPRVADNDFGRFANDDIPPDETVLLDGEFEAGDLEYFELGDCEVSPDHQWFAWSCDRTGSEFCDLFVRKIETGVDLDYMIADVESLTWITSEILLYTKIDENHRASKVFRHHLGTDPSNDELLMFEEDPRFSVSVGLMRTGTMVEISTGTDETDEVWLLPVADPLGQPFCVAERREGLEYSVDLQGEQLIILTNADGAVDFKIMTAQLNAPQPEHWQELLAHKPGRLLLSLDAFEHYIVWMERENALPLIRIRHNDGKEHAIRFDESAYSLGASASPESDAKQLRFVYSSPTTPEQWWDYEVETGARVLLKESVIPSGHNSDHYVTERLLVTGRDGEAIPITCLYHRDTPLDGTAPGMLYGYGAYGSSMSASFSSSRLSLVDRGFIHVTAHVRGGEEKGRDWYMTTKGEGKQQSFNDFIDCGKYLIENRLCSEERLVCMGGSAGGLLIGATINQAPELFCGAVAAVPFVDVLNTMLDDSLPLTPGEWAQWGNPREDAEAFAWIKDYSPYDQVSAQNYPALLVTASVSDPRVGYWEPAKWVARLRELKTDDNVLLFNTRMQAGHFGKSGRFGGLEDTALIYAFALQAAGV